ncbi:phage holin family protein [Serratia liquefaciens]|uniref:phage holin family protein n=1 Tax=Serratia liquefaciens TaxID=614 RepID=UPI0022B9F7E2|nr:phage holin family protein [Serratia liquefaciens]
MQHHHRNGPTHNVISTAKKAIRTLVSICQTRLELAIIELEEEKANIVKLFVISSLFLLFTLFAILSGLVLLFLSVSPEMRFMVFTWTTAAISLLAVASGVWVLLKIRSVSLLKNTRHQLKNDLKILGASDE